MTTPASPAVPGAAPARPLVGIGQVRHARLRPAGNAFAFSGAFG